MCIFSIFVDKGVQSLRDDSAVVGGRIRVHLALIILREILYVMTGIMTEILSLCGLYWFRIKISLCIY